MSPRSNLPPGRSSRAQRLSATMGSRTHTLAPRSSPSCMSPERLSFVGREIGFTPGRTVSLAVCLLALEDGRLAEVDSMSDAVYAGAKADLREHFIFSGGSRFDREFMIRVRPEIVPLLRE